MAIEGLDASLLIESTGFLAQAEATVGPPEGEPTLDSALAEAGRTAREAPDLWVTEGARGAGAIAHVSYPPLTVAAPVPDVAETGAPGDHPLVKERLTFAELGNVLANRQFDSTDYSWDETSTGDYEWAQRNFQDDVYAGVQEATQGASSPEEAAAMAQAYLNSIGLGGLVHIDGSAGGSNDEIVITASTNTFHPTSYVPVLTMDDGAFASFDLNAVADLLDVSAHSVAIDFARPLTEEEKAAVHTLVQYAEAMSNWLNTLPTNASFTLSNGDVVTASQLRVLFALADFRVVDNNTVFANGTSAFPGVGTADWNNGNPLFTIRIGDLIGYMSNPNNAILYLLHELAHVTDAGRQSSAAMFMAGSDGGTARTDAEHLANEQLANLLAREIAQAAGHGFTPNFTPLGGYGSMTITYSSGGGGTGGSGSGGGTGGGGTGGGFGNEGGVIP